MKHRSTDEEFIKLCNESVNIADLLEKLKLRPVGGNYKTVHYRAKRLGIDINHLKKGVCRTNHNSKRRASIPLDEILVKDSYYTSHTLKQRLIQEQIFSKECSMCKNSIWNDKPISLELEHKNGDKYDNRLENLCLLCPNCHAQTPTYRAKNKCNSTKPKTFSEKEFGIAAKNHVANDNTPIKEDILGRLLENIDTITHECKIATIKQLSKKYNTSYRTMYYFLKKNNISSGNKSRLLARCKLSKEELEIRIQNESMVAIGKSCGVTDNAIRARCRRLGIDLTKAKFAHHGKSSSVPDTINN